MTFSSKDLVDWKNGDAYKQGLKLVKHLRVINDTAEKELKLMEDFNKILTQRKSQKQFLLKVVTDQRRKISDCHKATSSKKI